MPEEMITYTGDIDSSATLAKTDDLYQDILRGTITIENPYNPITYIGDINSEVELEANPISDSVSNILFGTTTIESEDHSNDLVDGVATITSDTFNSDFDGQADIENDEFGYDIFDGNVELAYTNSVNKFIEGSTEIEQEQTNIDIEAEGFLIPENFNRNIISGEFEYEEGTNTTDLDGEVTLTLFNAWVDLASHIRVPCGRYIYSIFSKMAVVPGSNTDIISTIEVTDDGHYDIIRGTLNVDPENTETDLLDGEVELEKYKTTTIDCEVSINRVDTRCDLFSELYAAEGKNIDINCFMNVEPIPYRHGYLDIPSHLNAGFETIEDIFTGTLIAFQPERIECDIDCTLEVKPSIEDMIRIGIFVDPLWKMEPYVLKGTLTTLFDPLYHKERTNVIYGGNARALYMIKHFCEVYHVLHSRAIRVDYTQNPIINMHMVHEYTRALLHIRDKKHEYLDRVFIFANTSGQHGGSMLHPLLHHLSELDIETYVIDSSGNYLGLDTSNSTLIPLGTAPTSTYHYNPLHHIPVGMATKHRMIFDKKPVV